MGLKSVLSRRTGLEHLLGVSKNASPIGMNVIFVDVCNRKNIVFIYFMKPGRDQNGTAVISEKK